MKIEVDGVTYLPAVDISELPTQTFTTAFSKDGDSCTVDSLPFVMLSDLRKVAIRNTERETELEADLKEMADACLTKQCKIVELEAELSTFREQSERNCYTLGEPAKRLYDGRYYLNVSKADGKPNGVARWSTRSTDGDTPPAHWNVNYYELPLPTLPEPEEEPLLGRLKYALVSSCECGTKTPVVDYHSELCKYRLLSEAIAALSTGEKK